MTAFALKMIAVICMLLDHIGAVFPMMPVYLRCIGRVAFPLYAYLIAEGCMHTKNIGKYLLRLGIFALVSEIPFDLAFGQPVTVRAGSAFNISFISFTNIFYSLFLAVACIMIYEKLLLKANRMIAFIPMAAAVPLVLLFRDYYKVTMIIGGYTICLLLLSMLLPNAEEDKEVGAGGRMMALVPALPVILLGELLNTDYGMFAVAWILFLYLAKTKINRLIVLAAGIIFEYGYPMIANVQFRNITGVAYLVCALVAVVLVAFYNGQRGRRAKWLFYWFYPVHLAVLACIWLLVVRPMVNTL